MFHSPILTKKTMITQLAELYFPVTIKIAYTLQMRHLQVNTDNNKPKLDTVARSKHAISDSSFAMSYMKILAIIRQIAWHEQAFDGEI